MATNYTYADALKILTANAKMRISLGLDRIRAILELLNNPQDELKCIHVAGTNGKGSVCAMLSSILSNSGYKTGLFTSPHIIKYNERIQINGKQISDNDFIEYIFKITSIAAKNNIDLTEFEILTAVMFKYFYDNNVDIVVLETGLGGQYDATNVIKKNLCSIITHIDYDHTEYLGDTLDKIAYEKAGIIKSDCPCIVGEGKEVYYDIADKKNSELILVSPVLKNFNMSLRGLHQRDNLGLVLGAIGRCFPHITDEQIELGLKNVKHPCRFQYIESKNLLIDGAHNPNGIEALLKNLNEYYPNQKRRFIFGCLANKNYKEMIKKITEEQEQIAELYFYHFTHKNSARYEQLQSVCPIKAKELNPNNLPILDNKYLTIICGSFYMLPELLDIFRVNIFE